ALLRRCLAHPRTSGRTRFSPRLARLAAFYLPRRAWAFEGKNPSQAGLSVPHHLGRDRTRARTRAACGWGGVGNPSRGWGVWGGGSQSRPCAVVGGGPGHRRPPKISLEPEAETIIRPRDAA